MQHTDAGQRQLPAYKSHKTVRALKIASIEQTPADEPAAVAGGTWRLIPEDKSYDPITVSHSYVLKHNPQPGGYYVVYADGYASFSPAQAFEEGYTATAEDNTTGISIAAKYGTRTVGEADIRAAGADRALRITPADIEANIASEHYFTAGDGLIGNSSNGNIPDESVTALCLLTFCVLVLRNGTKIVGVNYGAIDPEQHDAERGRRDAREDAIRQVWPLLGYELRSQLSKAARRHDPFAQWQPNA